MGNKYYDGWEQKRALALIETNPLVAKIRLQRYIEKYKTDYISYIYYAAVLITLGEFDKAEEVLNDLETLIANDERYVSKIAEINRTKHRINILSSRMRLLAYQERYKDLYDFFKRHRDDIEKVELSLKPFLFYCEKKMGMLDNAERENRPYIFRQIVHYKESDFLEHIMKHQAQYRIDESEPNKSLFNPDFPLDEVLVEVKKHIASGATRLCPHLYTNMYVFKYDGCGTDADKTVNFFKVICFHNTTDLITMCPSAGCEELTYIDLNYLIKGKSNPKTRELSRIDKFNKRFRIPKSN